MKKSIIYPIESRTRCVEDHISLHISSHMPVIYPSSGSKLAEWVTRKHKKGKIHEPVLLSFITHFLNNYNINTFFDVGALYGYVSLHALSHIANSPVVHSFEMNPISFIEMQKLYSLNRHLPTDKWFCHNVGLANLHLGKTDISFQDMHLSMNPNELENKTSLNVTSLDHFCQNTHSAPDLIKIDIEGYEGVVLDGLAETLTRFKPIILLELHSDSSIKKHGGGRSGIIEKLWDLGYSCYEIDHRNQSMKVTKTIVLPKDIEMIISKRDTFLVCE